MAAACSAAEAELARRVLASFDCDARSGEWRVPPERQALAW
jgi:hypothetical protein